MANPIVWCDHRMVNLNRAIVLDCAGNRVPLRSE